MSEWYNDLDYHDFDGKHVLVTLDDGTTVSGAITYDTLGLTAKKEDDTCSGYICMSATAPILIGAYTAPKRLDILVNMEDCRWRPLDGIKSVDLIWDEKEYEQIPVNQIRNLDYVVFNGHLYQVTGALSPYFYIGVDSVVMYGRIDKSMISTALRRRSSRS